MGSKTMRISFGARSARIVALLLALTVVAFVTMQHSQSAFSGTASFGAGKTAQGATMSLGSTAAQSFDVNNLVPGDTMTRCVDITYTGNARSASIDKVKIYGTDSDTSSNLAQYLDLTADITAAGQTCATSGPTWTTFVTTRKLSTAFNAAAASYASNSFDPNWTPAATNETRAFRFVVTLPNSVGNEAQGLKASPTINWEVRTKGTAAR